MADQAQLQPAPEAADRAAVFASKQATAASEAPAPTDGSLTRRIGDRSLLDSELLEGIDRAVNAATARLTMGASPVGTAMTYFDWLAHLAASPGKQLRLLEHALTNAQRLGDYALKSATDPNAALCVDPGRDHRFAHEAWRRFPFNLIHQAFLLNEDMVARGDDRRPWRFPPR